MQKIRRSIKKIIKLSIISSFLFCVLKPSFSEITIDINNGINKPYPIIKFAFLNKSNKSKISNFELENIIVSDLINSGRFVFLDNLGDKKLSNINKMYISNPKKIPWSKIPNISKHADFILQGNINYKKNHDYDIEYALFNSQSRRLLNGKNFKDINPKQIRYLAHHISDQIYKAITGIDGYFSSKIAYVLVSRAPKIKYQLIVADSDGKNPHVLVEQGYYPIATPKFSPDGKLLAYVSYVKNRMAVYTISLNTGKRTLIANFPGINSAPTFSPDGKSLVMSLSKGNGSDSDVNLFIYNMKTKKFTKLTNFDTNTSPDFSADGKKILFTSNRSGSVQIYEINLINKKITQITKFGSQNFDAQYLSNNNFGKQKIVLMSQMDSGGPIRVGVLDLADKYGDNIKFITPGPLDKSPVISPNGQMILYISLNKINGSLKMVSANGQTRLTLPNAQGIIRSPAW